MLPTLAMDSYGQVLVAMTVVVLILALIGYVLLAHYGPRNAVIIVAMFLYIGSYAIDPGRSRELHGVVGLMQFTGFMGGVVGVVDAIHRYLFRRPARPPARRNDADDDTFTPESPDENADRHDR